MTEQELLQKRVELLNTLDSLPKVEDQLTQTQFMVELQRVALKREILKDIEQSLKS